MAKQKSNGSDYMSEKMDGQLEQLEDKITVLYANASYEVNQEWAKFSDTFKAKDATMLEKLENGEITQAEYTLWRNKNILQTDMYKSTVSSMTDILTRADVSAMAMVNDEMPAVVAESYDFVQALGWKSADEAGLSVGTFQIYNAESVQKIVRDNPDLLKSVDIPEDKKWNKDHINREITTGIIKGESIPKVADRLARVTDMDKNSATRNARTAMTYAENLGRTESAEKLKDMGIPEEEVWSATYDNRVRESHLLLDGTKRDENGLFGVGILATPLRCPADPDGDPEEIYNCRCRLNIVLKGIDHSKDADLYEQFMKENYPEDWQALNESKSYQEKQEQRYEATQVKADLEANRRASEASEDVSKEITPKDAEEATQGKSEAIESTSNKIEESAFAPATTIAEAEQYAKDNFIEGGGFNLTKTGSSFKGIDVDVANKINQRLTSIYDNFNISKMASLESYGKKDKRLYATNGDAPMITNPLGSIGLNNTYLKSTDIIDKYREEGESAFAFVADNLDSLSGSRRELAEAYINAGRDLVDGSIEGMITHEVGHLVSFLDINKEVSQVGKEGDWEEYAKNISGYATTSYAEYIAESFTAYYNGEYDILQPEIKSLFDGLRK